MLMNETKEYLVAALDEVKRKNEISTAIDDLKLRKRKLTKSLAADEKSMNTEIDSTVKNRRSQLVSTYDSRIDSNRDKRRKVMSKREKKKQQRMDERFMDETRHIREDNSDLKNEMSTLLRRNHLPSLCGTKGYYLLFSPSGAGEGMIMILLLAAIFIGIPTIVMEIIKHASLLKKPDTNVTAWCVVWFAVVFVFLLVIYILIFNTTRLKSPEVIKEARSIYDRIGANKRRMTAIRNSIDKDKDESGYNLEAYDEKLSQLDSEADEIGREKQEALRRFDDETAGILTDEIKQRKMPAIEEMRAELDAINADLETCERDFEQASARIQSEYGAYIGDDLCREDRLADLISLMDDGQAATVSQALELYRGN